MTNEAHSGHRMCSSILSWWTQQMRKTAKIWKEKKKDAEMRRTFRRWLLESDEPPSLSAGVKYRKLLLYNSKSKGTFFFLLPLPVCVDHFKLYLFFMAICMLKELLQEFLKGQQHFYGRVAPNDGLRRSLRSALSNIWDSNCTAYKHFY